jgi:hypothetical protein
MAHLGRQFLAAGLEPPVFVIFLCSTHLGFNSTALLSEGYVTPNANYHDVQSRATTPSTALSTPTKRTSGW